MKESSLKTTGTLKMKHPCSYCNKEQEITKEQVKISIEEGKPDYLVIFVRIICPECDSIILVRTYYI